MGQTLGPIAGPARLRPAGSHSRRRLLAIIGLAALAPAASLAANPPDTRPPEAGRPDTYRTAALLWKAGGDGKVPAARKLAQHDIVSLPNYRILDPDARWARLPDSLRAVNPDIVLLLYQDVNSLYHFQIDWKRQGAAVGGWHHDYLQAMLPYLAHTTTGDTLAIFRANYALNLIQPGCVEALVDVTARYWERHDPGPNVGLLLDFLSEELRWLGGTQTRWARQVHGEPDLDGDGIPFARDPDERQRWIAAQFALVREFRRRLPQAILVGNGRLARENTEMAAMLDGCLVEGCGRWGFGLDPYRNMFDPHFALNLQALRERFRRDRGGPYVLLDYKWAEPYAVILAQLSDCYGVVTPPGDGRGYWPPDPRFDLGEPRGSAVLRGRHIERDFARGSLQIQLSPPGTSRPFTWRILDRGSD